MFPAPSPYLGKNAHKVSSSISGRPLRFAAGRPFAAFGGIYIIASLTWLWVAARPDHFDLVGGAICLFGAALILLGPREVGG